MVCELNPICYRIEGYSRKIILRLMFSANILRLLILQTGGARASFGSENRSVATTRAGHKVLNRCTQLCYRTTPRVFEILTTY